MCLRCLARGTSATTASPEEGKKILNATDRDVLPQVWALVDAFVEEALAASVPTPSSGVSLSMETNKDSNWATMTAEEIAADIKKGKLALEQAVRRIDAANKGASDEERLRVRVPDFVCYAAASRERAQRIDRWLRPKEDSEAASR